jgi:hypothetical protein
MIEKTTAVIIGVVGFGAGVVGGVVIAFVLELQGDASKSSPSPNALSNDAEHGERNAATLAKEAIRMNQLQRELSTAKQIADEAQSQRLSLENRLNELQRTVDERNVALAKASDTTERKSLSSPSSKPIAEDITRWRRLRKGMDESDVRELLGEPRIVDAGGVLTVWYYFERYGSNVTFDTSGHVYGWSEPSPK